MTDPEKLMKAMAIVEVAVQEMADAGIDAQQRAIGLAFHMQQQVEIAMPTPETASFKLTLATT